jgi:hypothetical protein
MSDRLAVFFTVGCLACLLAGGCQGDVVPVSGRVTLNGKPLAGAVITFQPHSQSGTRRPRTTGSVGRSDEQGRFALRVIEPDGLGAAVGEHVVTISTANGGPEETAKAQRLPPAWSDGSKRFVVPPGGTTEANFDISDAPARENKGR